MQQLAEVAHGDCNVSNRWTIDQDSILFGLYYCKFMSSGRIYNPDKEKFLISIKNCFDAFQERFLSINERYPRTQKAIHARYKKLKDINRQNNRSHLSLLIQRFFRLKSLKLMKTTIFQEQNWGFSVNEIEAQIDNAVSINWEHLNIPIGHENERSNAWTRLENALLVGAVSKKFLATGSFFPPRGAEAGAWEEVHQYFKVLKNRSQENRPIPIEFSPREPSAIERHFKDFRNNEQHNIPAYYLYFKRLQMDGVV